jgi:hypothetical protein
MQVADEVRAGSDGFDSSEKGERERIEHAEGR